MIQIRNNIFETNSSSSHSIVVSEKNRGYCYNMPIDSKGTLIIEFDDYGWGPEILYTPYEKLCYWMTEYAKEFWYSPKKESFETRLQLFKEKKEIKEAIKTIKRLCKNVKKVDFERPCNDEVYCGFGSIDHDSVGLVRDEDFENLIFNNSVIIVIDNDNSNYFKPWLGELDNGEKSIRDPEELFDNDMNESTWAYDYVDEYSNEIVMKELKLMKR